MVFQSAEMNRAAIVRIGLSFVLFLGLAGFMSIFEVEELKNKKRQKKIKQNETNSLLVKEPTPKVGVIVSEVLEVESTTTESASQNEEKSSPEESQTNPEIQAIEISNQNEEVKEYIQSLEMELEKQRSYANSERQARVFVESQLKAESRLRGEAEDTLRLQSIEHDKQIKSLEAQLQTERKKCKDLNEKAHVLETKLDYLRTYKLNAPQTTSYSSSGYSTNGYYGYTVGNDA